MFGAIFALIILPIIIIGMSFIVYYVSRKPPKEKDLSNGNL